jgi:hypothetical protein
MPINPNVPIQSKGGLEENVQTHQAKERELMITTDSNNLYVGKGTGNNPVLVADSTVPNRVQALENKSNTIFTSNGDSFDNESKIASKSNLVVSAGLIRPTITYYQESLRNYPYLDERLTSETIQTTSSGASASNSTTDFGYVPSNYATQNQYLYHEMTTDAVYYFENASSITVTPQFNDATISSTRYYGSPKVQRDLPNINREKEPIYNVYKDSDNNIWHFNFYIGTAGWTGNLINSHLYYQKNDGNVITMFNDGTYQTAQNDTSRRNLSVTETETQIVVTYPISTTQYGIRFVNKNGSPNNDVYTINMTTTSIIIHCVEILWHQNKFHVLVSNQNGTTNRSIVYAQSNTIGNFVIADNDFFIRYPTIFTYSLKLIPISFDKVVWMGFSSQSTVATHYGIIDLASTTFPYQLRTSPVAVTSGTTYPYRAQGCVTLTSSGNGQGTGVYDPNTNFVYAMWGRSGNNDTQFVRIPLGASDLVPTVTTITTAPFDTFQNRDCDLMVLNTTTSFPLQLRCLWIGISRFRLYNGIVSCSSTGVFSIVETTEIYRKDITLSNLITPITNCKMVKRNDYNTSGEFDIYYVDSTNSKLYKSRYDNDIQPELFLQLQNSSFNPSYIGTPYSSGNGFYTELDTQLFNNQPKTFTFTTPYTGFIRLNFVFYYPIVTTGNSSNKTLTLTDVTIERDNSESVNGGSGEFISQPLISDRIVKNILLNSTQGLGSVSGNNIQWYVQAVDNGTWYQINNGQKVEFDEDDYGSQLRVKALLTWGVGTSSLSTVPYIDEYSVDTTNIITQTDLLPLQIDLMKMGINVNVLTTATRLDYKNMMIDTFSTVNGVSFEGIGGTGSYSFSGGTITNNGAVPLRITSNIETADIDNIVSIIGIWEGTSANNFEVTRDNGINWYSLQKETVFTFNNNANNPKNKVAIRITLPVGDSLYGWAYLYQ